MTEVTSKPHFFETVSKKENTLQELMQKWEHIQLEIEQFTD